MLILTHYYPPELGAPQTRLHETAVALRELGHAVRVLTCPPHYPSGTTFRGYRWWWPSTEVMDGIHVTRLPAIARPNTGLTNRVIDQSSFAFHAVAAAPVVQWSDLVLVESPPLFLAGTAAVLRMMAGRPYVLHVADPWPDFPIAMGAVASPYLKALAYGLEAFAYRHASIVTTVTRPLVEQLDRKQAARGKVRLLPNGVDTSRFLPDVRPHDARAQLGWPEARLTVVYAGTVGLAQGMQTLIEAALKLRSDGVTFVVVGQGQDFATLQAESFRRGISNVKFLPGVPTSDVPRLLAAADAILVMLKRGDVYRHWLPAKLLEGLAAGRPILASCDGEPARIVSEGNAGLVAAAEDADALARACIEMRDRVDRPATGTAAREVALASYDRLAIVRRLITYLQQASSNP